MTEAELIDIGRDGIWTLMLIAAPPLFTGLAIGLAIAILQTITQIQEATLTFVPKVFLVFGSILVFLPFMLSRITEFWQMLLDRLVSGGG